MAPWLATDFVPGLRGDHVDEIAVHDAVVEILNPGREVSRPCGGQWCDLYFRVLMVRAFGKPMSSGRFATTFVM